MQKFAAYDANGNITGFYDSVASPVPAGLTAIPITAAQWEECLGAASTVARYTVANGALVAPAPPSAASLLAAAQSSQAAAVTTACYATITGGFPSSALGSQHIYPSGNTPQHPDQSNLNASVTRALLASRKAGVWAAGATVAAGTLVADAAGDLYQCIVGGVTGAAAPAWPTETDKIVNDGSAQWQLWATPFWCADANGNWNWVNHTATQIMQVGDDATAFVLAQQAQNAILQAQIAAVAPDNPAGTGAVTAIVWTPAAV